MPLAGKLALSAFPVQILLSKNMRRFPTLLKKYISIMVHYDVVATDTWG